MCFSAQASFIAAGVLGGIGLVSLKSARTKSNTLLAITPLLFAFQQITEGIIWLLLPAMVPLFIIQCFVYLYLFIALPFWPIWLSSITYAMEPRANRKNILGIFLICATILGAYFIWHLLCLAPHARIVNCHIYYTLGLSYFSIYLTLFFYFLTTVIPLFICSKPYLWIFGVGITISYAISLIFYQMYFISVWCFFAAVLSLLICGIIFANNKIAKKV